MRIFLILAISLPCFLNAQINRSAKELAIENIQEYLVNKLFKDQPYKAVSFSDIKPAEESNKQISWTINHSFEIEETKIVADKKTALHKFYRFVFYLDSKMNVLKAVSFSG